MRRRPAASLSSWPCLTRPSINLRKDFREAGWMPGTSPGMTALTSPPQALRLRRRSLTNPREPCRDIGVGGIERLADLAAEIEPAIQMNVRKRKTLAADIVAAV